MTTTPASLATPGSDAETNPKKLGWMLGSPPPADKLVRFGDGSHFRFPQLRWALSHMGELVPTKIISRGSACVEPLLRNDRTDLGSVRFIPIGSSQSMSWDDSLAANYTDGIVVLHKGRIVSERYRGVLQAQMPHIAFSVTKSFVGLLAQMLVHEGILDEHALVGHYVPELNCSAFGDATVRQVLDMLTGLQYNEIYTDPEAEIWNHGRAGGLLPRPPGYAGPQSFYAFLQTVKKLGQHGEGFMYKTINTDTLGWVLRRVTGQSLTDMLSERLWSHLGCEQDATILVDSEGTEFAGAGLNTCLRDLARFGEMMRNGGWACGHQIVPTAVVEDVQRGASPEKFKTGGYVTLPGWSYRNMWWVSHNAHGAYMARGIHGQAIYIDPKAEMVIARYASHHVAGNMGIDPQSLPAYHAMAQFLMQNP